MEKATEDGLFGLSLEKGIKLKNNMDLNEISKYTTEYTKEDSLLDLKQVKAVEGLTDKEFKIKEIQINFNEDKFLYEIMQSVR